MKIYRGYKTELDPNDRQRSALSNHAGAARFAYNWGLNQKIKAYEETGKSPSYYDLHKELIRLKKTPIEEGGFPWLQEVSKCAPQEALRNLDCAFVNFFRCCKAGNKERGGFPNFKNKKRGEGSFTLLEHIRITESHIKLPRLGFIKLKEKGYLPVDGLPGIRVLSAAVSEKSGHWYVAVRVEQEISDPLTIEDKHIVGVDVGLKELATTSDGEVFENPRAYKNAQKRLRMLDKEVTRKKKGGKNRKKAVKRLAKLGKKIANLRKDNQHKASTAIAKSADVIVVESLNVAGMVKNRKLSKAVSDAGLSEFLRQLEYKAKWGGKLLEKASMWFPSSKTCSNCGSVKDELGLDERTFNCVDCGFSIDRDLNAAINLKNLAGGSPVSACCPGGSDADRIGRVKPLVGQEPNTSLEG
jgi:putative transposase